MCQTAVNNPEFKYVLENYKEICYNIRNAEIKYGAVDKSVKLMAVTKTVDPEKINYAVSLGVNLLGENRVQEFISKKDKYDKNADVHFIGHLQTNKVKYIINDVKLIQSVDSIKLANEINRLAIKNDKIMDILLEINIGNESSKSGVHSDNLFDLIYQISELTNVRIKGLMAIPPIGSGEDIFDKMNRLYNQVKEKNINNVSMEVLSMGMSGDYVTAIKHGANLVRIGTKLFGARNYMEV